MQGKYCIIYLVKNFTVYALPADRKVSTMSVMGISGSGVNWGYSWQQNGYGSNTSDPLAYGQDALNPMAQGEEDRQGPILNSGSTEKAMGRKSSPAECETCKNRKYQDGSNEMVSFKAAGHIAPSNAAAVVMGHEQEHVSNAYQKAANNNGEVVRASVRLKTDVCPECGRTYISGGETSTQIRYYNESNPYQKDLKESDADNKYRGMNVDIAA